MYDNLGPFPPEIWSIIFSKLCFESIYEITRKVTKPRRKRRLLKEYDDDLRYRKLNIMLACRGLYEIGKQYIDPNKAIGSFIPNFVSNRLRRRYGIHKVSQKEIDQELEWTICVYSTYKKARDLNALLGISLSNKYYNAILHLLPRAILDDKARLKICERVIKDMIMDKIRSSFIAEAVIWLSDAFASIYFYVRLLVQLGGHLLTIIWWAILGAIDFVQNMFEGADYFSQDWTWSDMFREFMYAISTYPSYLLDMIINILLAAVGLCCLPFICCIYSTEVIRFFTILIKQFLYEKFRNAWHFFLESFSSIYDNPIKRGKKATLRDRKRNRCEKKYR